MATWTPKVDTRPPGQEAILTDEPYVVGEDVPNMVLLNELPLKESPDSVTVTIEGTSLTRVTATPTSGQFRVLYEGVLQGAVEFHASASGSTALVSYKGTGSALFARDLNHIHTRKLDADGEQPAQALNIQDKFRFEYNEAANSLDIRFLG